MLKFHYQSSFYCTYVHIARNMSSFIQWTEFFYIQCTHFMSLYFTLSEWLTRLLYFVWVGVWRWNLMKTKSMVHGKYNSNMWLLRNIVFASLSSNNAFFLCFVDKHILIRGTFLFRTYYKMMICPQQKETSPLCLQPLHISQRNNIMNDMIILMTVLSFSQTTYFLFV